MQDQQEKTETGSLVGKRTDERLNYPSPVDVDNIGRVVGPDVGGRYMRFVGVEGKTAYFELAARLPKLGRG